jgi:sugar/nucleoside kinase (ribokinase family)
VTLARLGVPVAFIGRVGDDEAGRSIRSGLEHEGVDISGLRTVAGRSPVTIVLVEAETGERTLVPDVLGVPPIELAERDLAACAAAAWLHVDQTGYPALPEVRSAGIETPVSLDGGNFVDALDLAGIALYAPTERALLARYPGSALVDAMTAALAEGPELVAVTRGAHGSIAASRSPAGPPRMTTVPAIEVPVVSTLGAGDVFHGALLAALLDGNEVHEALQRANATAALACRALDGRSAIPTRAELDALLSTATAIATATSPPEVTHAG